MKMMLTTVVALMFSGCAMYAGDRNEVVDELVAPSPLGTVLTPRSTVVSPTIAEAYGVVEAPVTLAPACAGDVLPPANLAEYVVPVNDPDLLAEALGEPNEGKLCQGKVYQFRADALVPLYRAWNSTNPGSQFGTWWAAEQPKGKVADYRADYEICYQWSPIDKMTRCLIKTGTVMVVGTGQSATCSKYLTYPVSAKKQIYLKDAANELESCISGDDTFNWQ